MANIQLFALPIALWILLASPVYGHDAHQHAATNQTATGNKFLLMLFDGFRWDYLGNFSHLPNFNRFRLGGVHARYMTPNFPSLSYPGYYSVLTGRYPESNGFVENTMYDKEHDMVFFTDTDDNGSQPFWWNQTEPFWVSTVQAGLKTYVYRWPGCHVKMFGVQPTSYLKYDYFNDTQELQNNIEDVVLRFSTNEADVGIIYSEYTDHIGHVYGPESVEIKQAVDKIDEAIGLLLNQLKKQNLTNKVNIILVSDHGMTNIANDSRIDVVKYVNLDDVKYLLGYGPMMGFMPADGKLDKVYSDLKKIKDAYVWKKEEIPEELHLRNNDRVAPIVLAVKPNYFILPVINNTKQFPHKRDLNDYKGFHGYLPSDSKDMGAIFLAHGPDFRLRYEAPAIEMVDAYNLMTHVVNIEGRPNNGSWDRVKKMLRDSGMKSTMVDNATKTGNAPILQNSVWLFVLLHLLKFYFI